jgi:anti-anti-sigma regulatory factor
MKVKINTKEKFHVIVIEEPILSANMTEDLQKMLLLFLNKEVKNIILNLSLVQQMDEETAKFILDIHQTFYESNASFIVCEMQKNVKETFEREELLELVNATPTESEAWDVVQMEEIEREFLD